MVQINKLETKLPLLYFTSHLLYKLLCLQIKQRKNTKKKKAMQHHIEKAEINLPPL